MSNSIKSSGALKAFTAFILLYFAFQIYSAVYETLFFRFGPNSLTLQEFSRFVGQIPGYISIVLLIISGLLLFSLSKSNKDHNARIRAGAVLLIILGVYGIIIELLTDHYMQIFTFGGLSAISTSLATVTFFLVGISILSKRTRPLIYLATLLMAIILTASIVGLIGIFLNFAYTGIINTVFLNIFKFNLYTNWLPPLLYFIAFLFISRDFRVSSMPIKDVPTDKEDTDHGKTVVVEK